MKSIREKMAAGELYRATDAALVNEQIELAEKLYDFNHTRPKQQTRRAELLREILAETGEDCYVEPPLRANWGCHTHFGKDVYANFNLTLVDDGEIFVGDHVMFGPNATVIAGGHPIEPELRKQAFQYTVAVHIGNNVWIGAGAVILPGVTIGENSVIGAGSVVTKDVPPNVIAVGNPCKVLRPIGEKDREFYFKDRKIKA